MLDHVRRERRVCGNVGGVGECGAQRRERARGGDETPAIDAGTLAAPESPRATDEERDGDAERQRDDETHASRLRKPARDDDVREVDQEHREVDEAEHEEESLERHRGHSPRPGPSPPQ